jgi:hypothetical protein
MIDMVKWVVKSPVLNRNSDPTNLTRVSHARGQIGVILSLIMVVLLGAMAVAVDFAVNYGDWMRSQKAVDAAALAGANYLNGGISFSAVASQCAGEPDDAQKAACTYIINNGLAVDSTSLKINEPGKNLPVSAPTPNIQVWAHSTTPAYFGALLGLAGYNVATIATAQGNGPVNTITQGLFPMGAQCTSPCSLSNLNPGQMVQFGAKFSPTGAASGNWQWLSYGGTGASVLGANVQNGASASYSVGQQISSEPGNKGNAGPVKGGFSSRMSSCPAISDPCNGSNPNNIPAGDPCLVAVPAGDFNGCHGRCTLTIEAFANVYIEPSSTSTNINACFVNAVAAYSVGGGFGSSTPNLGAFSPPTLIQ